MEDVVIFFTNEEARFLVSLIGDYALRVNHTRNELQSKLGDMTSNSEDFSTVQKSMNEMKAVLERVDSVLLPLTSKLANGILRNTEKQESRL